ncbi:MAG: hypothetical protein JOY90_21830, partial [Bradyrhizobium sp.]|nr:hypothetical protein [Bradyrhizobium sp.]
MKKILIGLAAVIIVAAAGFFGFQFYTQQRIAAQLDASFEQLRGKGGKASYGKVAFDLLSRTVTIADLESESATQPPVRVKLANVTASGVGEPDATHFSADRIEAAGLELDVQLAAPANGHISYKAPKITVNAYSGPSSPRQQTSSSLIDVYRSLLEQFAEVNASQVSIPNLTGSLDFNGAAGAAGDFTYSDFAMENIKDGKIAAMKLADMTFNLTMQQAGKTEKLTGHVANIESHDVDSTALAAVLDPQKAGDDQYHRAYRQVSTGPYEFSAVAGPHMRIEGMSIEDVGLRPSRLQIPAILAVMPQPGTTPTPEQARELIDKVAAIYEGLRIGNAEMRGMSVDTPEGPFKLAAIRYSLDGGKGDFAIDGLQATTSKEPFQVGHFALKSLDIANLLRVSSQFTNPAQRPGPEQALQLLTALGGAEVKGVTAPFK